MSDEAQLRLAAALESPTAVLDDEAERLVAERLRLALAHPASWADAPALDLTAIMAGEPGRDGAEAPIIMTGPQPSPTQAPEVPASEVPAPEVPAPEVPAPMAPVVGLTDAKRRLAGNTGAWRARRPVRVAIGLAAAAVVLVVSGIVGYAVTRPDVESARFDLAGAGAFPSATAGVHAVDTSAGWHLTFTVSGLPPAAEGSYYEAWLAYNGAVVPLGTFHMRGPGEVDLWSGVNLPDGAKVMVTRQTLGNLQPQDLVLSGEVRR